MWRQISFNERTDKSEISKAGWKLVLQNFLFSRKPQILLL